LNPRTDGGSIIYMSSNDKPDKSTALGARLKFLREQWQQSVHEVCTTLEIDEKTLRAYEAGKALPTADVLDMLISHFLLTEDQAQDLRELADDGRDDPADAFAEDMLGKQIVMFLPIDSRIVYTDSMQATVNDKGVVMQFMQQNGPNQSLPVSRVGMSREHAERIIDVLQKTLGQYDKENKKKI
jgi:transcriptional regulator with XRE-family HTH domain